MKKWNAHSVGFAGCVGVLGLLTTATVALAAGPTHNCVCGPVTSCSGIPMTDSTDCPVGQQCSCTGVWDPILECWSSIEAKCVVVP